MDKDNYLKFRIKITNKRENSNFPIRIMDENKNSNFHNLILATRNYETYVIRCFAILHISSAEVINYDPLCIAFERHMSNTKFLTAQ